jgi:hypothetical protein
MTKDVSVESAAAQHTKVTAPKQEHMQLMTSSSESVSTVQQYYRAAV